MIDRPQKLEGKRKVVDVDEEEDVVEVEVPAKKNAHHGSQNLKLIKRKNRRTKQSIGEMMKSWYS